MNLSSMVAGLLVISPLILMSAASDARVRCKCPSIEAEGEGNSSCSAHESGGFCTIDFNEFPRALEQASAEIWRSSYSNFQWKPTTDSFQPFFRIDKYLEFLESSADTPKDFTGTVLVNLLVAAVKAQAVEVFDDDDLRMVVRHFYEWDTAVIPRQFGRQSFQFTEQLQDHEIRLESDDRGVMSQSGHGMRADQLSSLIDPKPFDVGNVRVIVGRGCIELVGNNAWSMYKTFWSPARQIPGCTP